MIRVELIGRDERGTETYTAVAKSKVPFSSDEEADAMIQELAEACAQDWLDAMDAPGEIQSIEVSHSYEDEVSPELEQRLRDRWDIDDVSLRYSPMSD